MKNHVEILKRCDEGCEGMEEKGGRALRRVKEEEEGREMREMPERTGEMMRDMPRDRKSSDLYREGG